MFCTLFIGIFLICLLVLICRHTLYLFVNLYTHIVFVCNSLISFNLYTHLVFVITLILRLIRVRITRLQLFLVSELFEFYMGELRELF